MVDSRPPVRRRLPLAGGSGQASMELVALVPALLVLALVGWQISVAAHAWLAAGGAARAGARAEAVGAPAAEAARRTLADGHAASAEVDLVADHDGERVRVRLRIPSVLPWLPHPGRVAASVAVPPNAPEAPP